MTALPSYPDALLRRAFAETSTIAVVGASSNPARASNYVMAFLQTRGWRAIPVNPNEVGQMINGERVYAALADIPFPVQMVDVFRNSSAAGGVVDEAIALKARLGIRFVWMQLGVVDDAAARRGEKAGIKRNYEPLPEDRNSAPVWQCRSLGHRAPSGCYRSVVDGDFCQVAVRIADVDRRHRSECSQASNRAFHRIDTAGIEMNEHAFDRLSGNKAQIS